MFFRTQTSLILFLVASFVLASGCSFGPPQSQSVTVTFPQASAEASRFGISHRRSTSSSPQSLNDFTCFAVNVSGSGIAPTPDSSFSCKVAGSALPSIFVGFQPTSGGSITVLVPAGPARTIQLLGIQTTNGTCPAATDMLASSSEFTSGKTTYPYQLGAATADITGDTMITLTASFSPKSPVFAFGDGSCLSTTTATSSSGGTNVAPTFTLVTPNPSATASAYSIATLTGTSGAVASGGNVLLNLYLNDASCASGNLVGSFTIAPSSAYTMTTSSLVAGGDGLKKFFYTSVDPATGNVAQSCTATGLSYTFQQTPKISFSRMGYTLLETGGTPVGTPVTLWRDVCGVTSTISISNTSVTATSGTNFVSTSHTYSFASNNCNSTFTIPASDFSISNQSTSADIFFRSAIQGISGGAAAVQNQVAQINIIGSGTSANTGYMFVQPLFTVPLGATSASLVVQKIGGTNAASNVSINFVDGSAQGGTDYNNASQTINFPVGAAEYTVTVPITSSSGKNVSFDAKLVNPSVNTSLRTLSIAKVRIMNEANSGCVSTNAPFGNSGSGVGSSASNPYLVCSLTQLLNVSTYPSSYFKLEADLIANASLGTLGTFSAGFNGNEHIIDGFTYNGLGLFASVGSNTAINIQISNLNLLNVLMTNSMSGNSGGILAGSVTSGNYSPSFENDLVTGSLNPTSATSDTGMLIGNTTAAPSGHTNTFTISNCLTYGSLNVPIAAGFVAGMVGNYTEQGLGSIVMMHDYNMVNVTAMPNANNRGTAGVLGENTPYSVELLNDLENRGTISALGSSYGSDVGGIIGMDYPGATYTLANSTNYGFVYGAANNVGGLIGYSTLFPATHAVITNSANYGSISGTAYVGGLFGELSPNRGSNVYYGIYNVTNGGTIMASSGIAGGIIGAFTIASNSYSGDSITISGSVNNGAINAPTYVGGIAGQIFFGNYSTGGNFAYLTLNTNNGSLNTSGNDVGGLIGDFESSSLNNAALSITHSSSSSLAAIVASTSATGIGGIIGYQYTSAGISPALYLDHLDCASFISQGSSYIGGIVGYSFHSNAGSFILSNSTFEGIMNPSATSNMIGGLIGSMQNSAGAFSLIHSNNSGTISTGSSTNSSMIGGLIGMAYLANAVSSTILNSYVGPSNANGNGGNVTGGYEMGGLIGYLSDNAGSDTMTIQDSYVGKSVIDAVNGGTTGGFIGNVYNGGTTLTINLNRIYNSSSMPGAVYGEIALITGATTTTNCSSALWYQDTGVNTSVNSSNSSTACNGSYRTGTALETSATFSAVDGTWTFGGSSPWNSLVTGQFPTLAGFPNVFP